MVGDFHAFRQWHFAVLVDEREGTAREIIFVPIEDCRELRPHTRLVILHTSLGVDESAREFIQFPIEGVAFEGLAIERRTTPAGTIQSEVYTGTVKLSTDDFVFEFFETGLLACDPECCRR